MQVTFLLGAATTSQVIAQQEVQDVPKFSVAAINPSQGGDHGYDPERLTWENMSLSELIQQAYRVRAHQIVNLPNSFDGDRWTIRAKADARPGQRLPISQMLQALLMERFQLRCHSEMRQLSRYVLTAAKNAPKIRPVVQSDPEYGKPGTTVVGRGVLEFRRASMASLASRLSRELRIEVVDRTGLTGVYTFQLKWLPDGLQMNDVGERPQNDEFGLSIFGAVRQQLGLELKVEKGPVSVIVIDHVSRLPTPN